MKGGYQIIDLRNIGLELSDSTGNIMDVEILKQLRSLRSYIEEDHNYAKPLNNALKCIIVRYRDAKNGEKLEACQWANIVCSNDSLTYEIKTKDLMIEVVFEEKTDEYSNKYYDIKTAKYLYNYNEIIEGDLLVSGDASFGGDIEVDETSKVKVFENIVDKDGHKRFIEGDVNLVDTELNITKLFGKWSLSGTHLMIVLALGLANETVWISGTIASMELPKWIVDKIVPLYSIEVAQNTTTFRANDTSGQNAETYLEKTVSGISIYMSAITLTADRQGRIQFDLLIDNE